MIRRKFDGPAQETFLMLLEGGAYRAEAARRVGVSPATVRAALKMGLDSGGNPLPGTFAERVAEVEEMERGEIESKLYEAAKDGQPWAIQMWLKGKYREDWADKPGPLVAINQNTVNIQGTPDEQRRQIESLAAELDARREIAPASAPGEEIVEAEIADAEDVQ